MEASGRGLVGGNALKRRIGAYVLPGDPVWLAESLAQYYPLLDDLVVPVPADGLGWSGLPVPVGDCLAAIRSLDTRRIAREFAGHWVNVESPIHADTAQRQSGLDQLATSVDWVVQLDNDEFLPRPALLIEAIDRAEELHVDAVELPMRVLFRRTRKHVFEVTEEGGAPHHEYPGCVIVRPNVRLQNARQVEGPFLRLAAARAGASIQLARPAAEDELRLTNLDEGDAIVHNSWARSPEEIRRKVGSWGHSGDTNFHRYYWFRWWPVPWIWRLLRNFHPFSKGLWPRLRRLPNAGVVADHPQA